MIKGNYLNKPKDYFLHQRKEMMQFIPINAKTVLDIGCSSGNFGKLIKDNYNCIVWGVEQDSVAAEQASFVLDNVINTQFDENINLQNKKFDCIVFNDVLEHFEDPNSKISFCKNLLNTSGVLVCSIPNIRYFDAFWHIFFKKDFEYTNDGIFDRTHLRFFTKKSIIRMFENEGYNIMQIEGINPLSVCNSPLSKRFMILKRIFPSFFEDMEFLQFAVVAAL